MDKSQLNLEIIVCRALVKKAKVCVIRKLLKKIKILRTCKNEEFREKKFRKARRLVAEIHMMKKLHPDYITKWALVTENFVYAGSNTRLKRKKNACAKISKHKGFMAKINAIRNKFIDWRKDLPPLLVKKKKIEEDISSQSKIETDDKNNKESENINEDNGREEEGKDESIDSEDKETDEESENENTHQVVKPQMHKSKVNKKSLLESHVPTAENVKPSSEKDTKQKKIIKSKGESQIMKEEVIVKKVINEEQNAEENIDNEEIEEKMDDPFFIGKKIIVPKLLQKGNQNHPENEFCVRKKQLSTNEEEEVRQRKKWNMTGEYEWEVKGAKFGKFGGNMKNKIEKRKREELTTDELHPSWKAKKMQMIKPFQGKKIIFE